MTAAEHRALGRAAALLLVSGVVRWGWEVRRGPPVLPDGKEDARPALLAEAVARQAEEARRTAPLGPDERLDANRAPEAELDRLPGVGPATARAIVEARSRRGGFRSVEELLEVRGIGPATLARARAHLEVGAVPPELARRGRTRSGAGPPGAGSPTVDVNHAGPAELETLPGIGPALAERIVAHRRDHGPFTTVDALLGVRGIGPATLERIRSRVRLR